MNRRGSAVELPTLRQVEAERKRLCARRRYGWTLWGIFSGLLVLTAGAVLLAALVFPVFQVLGDEMEPVLAEGEIVVVGRRVSVKVGDLAACYSGNVLQIRRVVAEGGETENISEGSELYTREKMLENQDFLNSDGENQDLGNTLQLEGGQYLLRDEAGQMQTVAAEQVVGPVLLRVWPMEGFGWIQDGNTVERG